MLRHISFGEDAKTLAILVPNKDFDKTSIYEHYVKPLVARGIKEGEIIALNLGHKDNGKTPISEIVKPWITKMEKVITGLPVRYVLIAEGNYFKTICKQRKTDPHYGYPLETIWPNITGFLTTNYRALMFNPAVQSKIDMSLDAVAAEMTGQAGLFDKLALQDLELPEFHQLPTVLSRLQQRPALAVDIEGYSLRVDKAQIATIAFGLDTKSAVAFPVGQNQHVKALLKKFFKMYKGSLIFHNCTYDTKVLIWELFMDHPTDYKGMLEGLHVLHRNLHDTKAQAYLALNSCADVSLSLKDLAFEHTGNYAVDVQDITKVPIMELLEYNASDTVATWYVYDKYRQRVKDEQEDVYQKVFRPTLKTLTQMELCGTPINLGAVLIAEGKMQQISKKHWDAIMNDKDIQNFEWELRDLEARKANLKLKKLRKTAKDFVQFRFNPNSDTQLGYLLYEYWALPVLEKTAGGNPSTKNSVLRDLMAHISDPKQKEIVEHIIELHEVSKILNTFIPAFKANSIPKDGWHYLHGGFNLGGTKSGRLSSSEPNMQNIPSTGTQYAKLIKGCFQPPRSADPTATQEWIFVGADYASLEDRISALQTKDPNKLAVYEDGYDGHCLRAYSYFTEQMPKVTEALQRGEDRVTTINKIEDWYPELRQASKGPTFLLTYMGTWKGLMKTFGFTETEAKEIERRYHELYAVADQWVLDRLKEASRTGYVELAFGLRLRTPLLKRVIVNSDSMPFQAHQEMKTAGNALGQSYGLMNSNSANLFMERVWKSKYKYDIMPCMQVHDSQYYMVKNKLSVLKWVNDNLIECMEWNNLPEIQHPTVKLGASLELYHTSWADRITLPNRASKKELRSTIKQAMAARKGV